MRKFMLITNRYKDRDLTLSNEIVSYIQQKGGSAAICVSNVEDDNQKDFALSEIPADTECILVLGGDGTLIRAATKVEALQIPLIGVNLGTLGYLCELEEATVFHAIDCLMQDACIMEERIVLNRRKNWRNGAHMALNDVRAIARILERGKLVWRVRMVFLCVVNLQQWSIISLCGGDADGHAAQQRCRGGQPCEKLPHLHENLLFLDCWLLFSAIAGGGNPTRPRDPQILCCSAEPLLTSPLVGRSDGEQCQHANSAGRNLPPSFRTHAARQWQ